MFLILKMTLQAKLMSKTLMKQKLGHCKLHIWGVAHYQKFSILGTAIKNSKKRKCYLQRISSHSPFKVPMETEGNSPSASTPTSPQTKTASEGELSTTAAELLQDYMTTVWCHFLLFLFYLLCGFVFQAVLILVSICNYPFPLIAADKAIITGDPAICYSAPWIS